MVKGLQRVRPGSPVDPQDTPMASEATLAALAQQRQALEASIQGKPGAPANVKLVSASAPRG
ncbi:hypothetical protein D3C84_1275070 [compost metagenome]